MTDIIIKESDLSLKDLIGFECVAGTISEAEVDTYVVNILKDNGWNFPENIKQQKTGVQSIDSQIFSKSKKEKRGLGKGDVYIINGEKLLAIIENKDKPTPAKIASVTINEAIGYADSYYENTKCRVKYVGAFDSVNYISKIWDGSSYVDIKINGEVRNILPSKKFITFLYKSIPYFDNIVIEEDSTKNIHDCKQVLKEVIPALKKCYRIMPSIQNANKLSIDFTVSFFALKSISERYEDFFVSNNQEHLLWKNLKHGNHSQPGENIIKNVKQFIEWLFSKDLKDDNPNHPIFEYRNLFRITKQTQQSNQDIVFDFKGTLDNLTPQDRFNLSGDNKTKSMMDDRMLFIYEELSKFTNLHEAKIDIFGELYESLADKTTKKSFGQYFTGRNYIQSLISIFFHKDNSEDFEVQFRTNEGEFKTICDPACGTGGFLTETFKYISNKSKNIDVQQLAQKSFYGYDLYEDNIVRAKVNMYLAGDGVSEIEKQNSLTLTKKFNYVVTNPPYGSGEKVTNTILRTVRDKKGVISIGYVKYESSRNEVNFLLKIIDLLLPNGRGLLILPDGIFESTKLNVVREHLIRTCKIEFIISLPKFAFAPYTKEKTYAIAIKKREQPIEGEEYPDESFWMHIIDNDGYANSDKKFKTDRVDATGKWLHNELDGYTDIAGRWHESSLFKHYVANKQLEKNYYNEWGDEIKGDKCKTISLSDVLDNEFISYDTVSLDNILKELKIPVKGVKAEKLAKIMSTEGDLNEDCINYISNNNIVYDEKDECFYDMNKPISNKLYTLLPEKFLRSDYQSIDIQDFIKIEEDKLNTSIRLIKELLLKLES